MARARMLLAFVVVASLLLPGTPQAAESCEQGTPAAFLNLRIGDYFGICPLNFTAGILFVYVDVRSVPMSQVHLSIQDPPFGTLLGAQWNPNFSVTGDLQTGVDISLGSCTDGALLTLGYLVVLVPSGLPADCGTWKVDDGAEVVDCEAVVRPASSPPFLVSAGGGFCQCCMECGIQCVPAYDLAPPDGALAVGLDASLTWEGIDPLQPNCSVQIGTDPDCATWTTYPVDCGAQAFAPDFLHPATTYYWRVAYSNGWCGAHSPSRSFTTQGPVSTLTATWGSVKAMYRE